MTNEMKEYLNSITPIDTTISRARVDQLKREGIESYRRERTANKGGDKNGQEENKRQRQAQGPKKDVEEIAEYSTKEIPISAISAEKSTLTCPALTLSAVIIYRSLLSIPSKIGITQLICSSHSTGLA